MDLGLETQGYRKKCLQHKFVSKSRERPSHFSLATQLECPRIWVTGWKTIVRPGELPNPVRLLGLNRL